MGWIAADNCDSCNAIVDPKLLCAYSQDQTSYDTHCGSNSDNNENKATCGGTLGDFYYNMCINVFSSLTDGSLLPQQNANIVVCSGSCKALAKFRGVATIEVTEACSCLCKNTKQSKLNKLEFWHPCSNISVLAYL